MNKIALTIVLFLFSFLVIAQENKILKNNKPINKGKFFAYWGWNWARYSDSDIRFKGENYNFTVSNVKAQDRQTKFSFHDYFHPTRITIPQTNYRIGYFFKENYTISVGVDHMKYIVIADQNVITNGTISSGNELFDKTYSNETIQLSDDFLQFEHTDGLNYINVEIKRFDNISHWFGLEMKNLQFNLTEGVGTGILFPKTNSTLLGKERHDDFHLSGWGISAGAGLNITFLKHFFIQADYKIGYIDMPSIRTTLSPSDTASQNFFFFENTFLFGGRFKLF